MGAAQKMPAHKVIDRFPHGCYKDAQCFRLQRPCKGLPLGQGNNGVSLRTQDSTAWTMASSGPADLRAFLLPLSSRLNHDGADEPNYGKVIMECEENLGLETMD